MGNHFRFTRFYLLCIILCFTVSLSQSSLSFGAQNDSSVFGFPLKNQTVLEGYSTSTGEFSSGHRGVDFIASRGSSVYAIADARVIFAGKVAGKLYITLDHGGDFKSTYSVMATSAVKLGDTVSKGSVIGTAAGYTSAGSINAFMLTLRFKDKYVDPMKYLKGEIPVREISLGAISKKDKSWFQKMWDLEKKRIKEFVSAGKEIFDVSVKASQEARSFIEWVINEGSEALNNGAEEFVDLYNEAKDYVDSMAEIANQILVDQANGLKEKVNAGIKKLREMEKVAVEKIRDFMSAAKEWGQMYLEYFKKALSYGIDMATWFYDFTKGVVKLKKDVIVGLILGIYDVGLSAVHVTFKVLDGIYDVDWKMMAREVFLPYSCIAGGCINPVELACDPKARLDVRSSKQGYKGSGNKVMFVSGLNSEGSPKVLKQDDGTGTKVGQTVNFPWKTLGYSKNDVSYYTYGMPGESFNSDQPNQNLFVSAKTMDAQIRQWKIDNPGEKLDLITHSLGGAVTSIWLAEYYDKNDQSYPPLGKIIMYAPPLTGTALASAGGKIDSDRNGKDFHDDLNARFDNQFPSSSDSIKQVQENGELEQILKDSDVLQKVKVYSIVSGSDPVVTAASQPIEGLTQIVLDTNGVNQEDAFLETLKGNPDLAKKYLENEILSHSNITTDKKSTAAAQYILQGEKIPCVPVVDSFRAIGKATMVRASELTLGRTIKTTTDAINYQDISNFLNVLVR